jgi:hypothetical protein
MQALMRHFSLLRTATKRPQKVGGTNTPLVIECTIWHILDIALVQLEVLSDGRNNFVHAALFLCPNVVDLADPALVQNSVEGTSYITHVKVRSDSLPISMHREHVTTACQESHLRDELLWKLMGPIDIVSSRDDAWQLVRCHVRLHHHLSARLGSGIRIGRFKSGGLIASRLLAQG